MSKFERITKSDQTLCLGTSTCGYCDENCPARNPLYRFLARYEDSGLSASEVAELAKAKVEGRILPENFSCLILSDGKTLAVWYPEGRHVATEKRHYLEPSGGKSNG